MRVFNELAILPDGARWGFTRGTLSRLTGITDPAGYGWVREYDRIGNLTAVVDPTGVRTDPTGVRTYAAIDRKAGTAILADGFASATYSFDEYGRPARAETADGSAALTAYTVAGNPAELIDGDGGRTVVGQREPDPTLAGIGSAQVLSLPGGVTAIGEGWIAPGWRAARATDETDP